MATKKSTTKSTKSRVASSAKKKSFISKPLAIVLGVVLIIAVAVAGIIIYYNNSFAASWSGVTYDQWIRNVWWQYLNDGTQGRCIATDASGTWCTGPRYKFDSGLAQWRRQSDGKCATIAPTGVSGKDGYNWYTLSAGKTYWNGQRIHISETTSCDKV